MDNSGSFNKETKNGLWERIEYSVYRKRRNRVIGTLGAIITVFATGMFFWIYLGAGRDTAWEMKHAAQLSAGLLKSGEGRIQMLALSKKSLKKRKTKPGKEQFTILRDSISYVQQLTSREATDYKTVYVPYGMRQEVILQDGSKIWLNAGSLLTFPATFDGPQREVFLNGEAYFEIAQQTKPFRVVTNDGTIQVLGTSFNVSNYAEDREMLTELITGRIAFESENQRTIQLKPGQLLALNRAEKKLSMRNGTDHSGMLWTKKQLALDKTAMPVLFKKLERIFNVNIHYPKTLHPVNVAYSGRISLNGSIENVLKSIYELENYQILINKKEVYLMQK